MVQLRRNDKTSKLTNLKVPIFSQVIGVTGFIRLTGLARLAAATKTEDIRNDVSRPCGLIPGLHTKSYGDVRLTLRIGIVFRIFTKALKWIMSNSSCK